MVSNIIIIATANALVPNRHQYISCVNAETSSVESVVTKAVIFLLISYENAPGPNGMKIYLRYLVTLNTYEKC